MDGRLKYGSHLGRGTIAAMLALGWPLGRGEWGGKMVALLGAVILQEKRWQPRWRWEERIWQHVGGSHLGGGGGGDGSHVEGGHLGREKMADILGADLLKAERW